MNSYVYLGVLTLHVASLALFGGMVLITDLRLLGIGMRSYSVSEMIDGLRVPKRIGLASAVLSGIVLFSFQAGRYLSDPWFHTKITLLLLLCGNYMLFGRHLQKPGNAKLAGGLSLLLWTGVICAGRGPATIKDVMHSMVDPNGDAVFASVQEVADQSGTHQEAPRTDADWAELRRRLEILQEVPSLVEGRQASRIRDRSKNPQSESQPEEIERALDADRPSLARRARKLQDAAGLAIKAVDAKDTAALLRSIDLIDKACENCHLHYWYPNDQRAQQAAKEDGVTDY
jgi:hypothetical protein